LKADFVAILRDHAPFVDHRLSLKADFVAIYRVGPDFVAICLRPPFPVRFYKPSLFGQ
jgi:hypothetical protein